MANNTSISKHPSLPLLQRQVAEFCVSRGFDKETVPQVFTLLVEEVGELAKALRGVSGQKIDLQSSHFEVADEAADILWVLLDLCNHLTIDLEQAFWDKEAKNQKRQWK